MHVLSILDKYASATHTHACIRASKMKIVILFDRMRALSVRVVPGGRDDEYDGLFVHRLGAIIGKREAYREKIWYDETMEGE